MFFLFIYIIHEVNVKTIISPSIVEYYPMMCMIIDLTDFSYNILWIGKNNEGRVDNFYNSKTGSRTIY